MSRNMPTACKLSVSDPVRAFPIQESREQIELLVTVQSDFLKKERKKKKQGYIRTQVKDQMKTEIANYKIAGRSSAAVQCM